MAAAVDWNAPAIPNTFNYVWMGTHEEKFGKTDVPGVKGIDSVRANTPGYTINFWIDVFSMMDDGNLRDILNAAQPGLWELYDAIQPNRRGRTTFADVIPLPTFDASMDILRQAQRAISNWLLIPANLQSTRQNNPHVHFFDTTICTAANVTLRFLDTELYPGWLAVAGTPEYNLLSWTLFERYARGANWGACSDMLRVQLLISRPGLYIDHDDRMIAPFPQPPTGAVYTRTSSAGQGNAILTSSFLGFCPNHPLLLDYRARILDSYTNLRAAKFMTAQTAVPTNYTVLQPPAVPNDFVASDMERETLWRSGPAMFNTVYTAPAMAALCPNRGLGWQRGVFKINSSKAWL